MSSPLLGCAAPGFALLALTAVLPSVPQSIQDRAGARPADPTKSSPLSQEEAEEIELPTLWVGDKAPPLSIREWLHGTPFGVFEYGHLYLVVTCGNNTPLLGDALEPLTAFQEEMTEAGVKVLATACGDDKELGELRQYVAEHEAEIGFTIGFEKESAMDQAWRKAAQWLLPPSYFLVDRDGNIAWIGDGLDLEPTLGLVLRDEHDLVAAAERYKREFVVELRARQQILALNLAWKSGEWQKVSDAVDRLLAIDPVLLGGHVAAKLLAVALGMEKPDEAYAFAKQFVEGVGKDSPMGLSAIAWTIVDPEGELEPKDLDLALYAAERAVALTHQEDGAFLDTLAVVHHARGELDLALKTARMAAAIDEWFQSRVDEWEAEKKGGG